MKIGLLGMLLVVWCQYAVIIDYTAVGAAGLLQQQSLPETFLIKQLRVHADIGIDRAEFCALTGLKEHVKISRRELANSCFYLQQTQRWQTIKLQVEPTLAGVFVTFFLTARWRVRAINVRGLWFGKQKIKQHFLLLPGEPFDDNKYRVALAKLRTWFKKNGYYHARVDAMVIRDVRTKMVTIVLTVNKGPCFKIAGVTVRVLSAEKNFLDFGERLEHQLMLLLSKKYYLHADLKKVRCFVRRLLIEQRVPFAPITITESKTGSAELALTVTIDCALRHRIIITGNHHVRFEQLVEYILQDEHILSHFSLPLFIDGITRYYHAHGFFRANVTMQQRGDGWYITVHEGAMQKGGTKSENSDFFVDKKKKLFVPEAMLFGKTVVRGNVHTRAQRLINLCTYCEGETFDVRKLHETFDALTGLEVFDAVRLFPLAQYDVLGRRPMVLVVDEGNPFEMRLRLGLIGTNRLALSTYSVGISLSGKNVTHNADTLTINAEFTRFCRDLVCSYRYPRVGGLPLGVQVQLFDKKTDCPCLNVPNCMLYTALQRGVAVQADGRAGQLRALMHAGVEAINTTHLFESAARALLFEPSLRNVYEPFFHVEPSCYITMIDDPLNPRRGITTYLCIRGMIAQRMLDASFVRFLLEQAFFVPLGVRIVGALRLRMGYIAGAPFSHIMPSERFYLGGACSIRAYQQDMAPPLVRWQRDCSPSQNEQPCWAPLGSKLMGAANVEVRIDVYKQLAVVLFQDMGVLRDERTQRLCVDGATGFGVRYLTPLGPLRFDFGFKNTSSYGDRLPCAWFLTIGQAF